MKTVNMRAVLVALAALAMGGCAGDRTLEMAASEQSAQAIATTAVEARDLPADLPADLRADTPAPEAGDLLAKARAIAASKGSGGSEDEARARAALAPMAGGGAAAGNAASNPANDPQAIFQRAAMRFAAQGGGDQTNDRASDRTRDKTSDKTSYTSNVTKAERLDANDPREIFRKAQALARDRALSDARAFGGLADSRAFGAGAPTQTPASNAQTYFVEAMRLRQQQSGLALGALAQ